MLNPDNPALIVTCPTCDSPPGFPCETAGRNPRKTAHRAREKKARPSDADVIDLMSALRDSLNNRGKK